MQEIRQVTIEELIEETKATTDWRRGFIGTLVRTEPKIGRNEMCPKCDSDKKYKKCCGKGI